MKSVVQIAVAVGSILSVTLPLACIDKHAASKVRPGPTKIKQALAFSDTCQLASNDFGIVANVTWGFAPPSVQSWWSANSCHSRPWSDPCQTASDFYGYDVGNTRGFAPASVQTWWNQHGCQTQPRLPDGTCQRASDDYGIQAGVTFGFAPADVQTWWIREGCNTSPRTNDTCQKISNYYGTSYELTMGFASPEAQAVYLSSGCQTFPLPPIRTGLIQAESFEDGTPERADPAFTWIAPPSWLLYRAVDFGSSGQFNRVRFNLSSTRGTAEVAVHLDTLGGQTVADLATLATGDSNPPIFAIESAALAPNLSGLHDVFLTAGGGETVALDWFALSKAPVQSMVAIDPGPMPAPGAPPDLSALPTVAQDDAPANSMWLPTNPNVTIQPQAAEGIQVALARPQTVTAQVEWTGGSGPVTLSINDQAANPITPASSRTYAADNIVRVETAVLAAQTIIVSVRNNGSSPITTNLRVGGVPPSNNQVGSVQ